MAICATSNIGKVDFNAKANDKLVDKKGKVKTKVDHFVEFTDSGYGAYRTLQLLDKVGKAGSMVLQEYQMPEMAGKVDNLCGKLNTASAWTLVPHLPRVTKNAAEAFFGEVKATPVNDLRDRTKAVRDVADCGASWSYVGVMVTGDVGLKRLGDGFSLISDLSDLHGACEDFWYSKKCLEHIPADNVEMQTLFGDTVKFNLLKIIKAACCIASTIFGLMALGLGSAVLSPTAALALGLISTIAAIAIHFYEATADYKMVSFADYHKPDFA